MIVLSACSDAPKPAATTEAEAKKEPAAPVAPVPAKTAFWPMYMSARSWATDFSTLRIESKDVPGFKNADGKAAMWAATFASPSHSEFRTYTYSIAAVPPDIYKGVVVGGGMPWSGPSRNAMPIQSGDISVDSDAAYQTAAADADAWLKKNPDKKLTTLQLVNEFRFQAPVWYFMWGDKKMGYAAFVNASTGKLLKH
jgi:hypothetical protein